MNRIAGMVLAWIVACAAAGAGAGAATSADPTQSHPAADTLKRIFADGAAPPVGFRATGLSRKDYLALMAGNVDFFRQHQDERGAIIDPYEKKERQYSTPAFALAAALLIAEADRGDLLEPASHALSFSIAAMANNTTADNHPDFYIPMVIHARRLLASRVKAETAQAWERNLRGLVPESTYRDTAGGGGPRGNWNVVNVAGELLRRKDGLVPDDRLAEHLKYIDRCLEAQRKRMTNFGMYEDPNAPLAYDAFPRLWLEDALADGAYDDGAHREHLERWLTMGGLSTLLLLSPAGEWPCGGRSAFHQWNEAEIAVISEINAARWKRWGRADVAGAFKRAAHLALESMRRWRRPSGELWIVKNRADPARRHGYEGYSFHSQYNLLAMAMLAIAYQRADDSIEERPVPSESASYVYDLRETFHKICAAAGGTYILIDTSADPHYNATGLQRIHKAGVAFSPLSDSAAAERSYGPGSARFKVAISPAMAWNDAGGRGGEWLSLSQFGVKAGRRSHTVRLTDLTIERQTGEAVEFHVRYLLEGPGARIVEEGYRVDASGVEVRSKIGGDAPPAMARVTFPVLVSDGSAKTQVTVDGPGLTIRHRGGRLSWEILGTESAKVQVIAPDVACHAGLVRLAVAELPRGTQEARWRITLVAEAPAE